MSSNMLCPHCGKTLAVVSEPLTKRQAELYGFLVESTREHRYAPSFDEIAARFGYSSLATVHEHLHNLEDKGYIRREAMMARGIQCLVALDDIGEPPLADYSGERSE